MISRTGATEADIEAQAPGRRAWSPQIGAEHDGGERRAEGDQPAGGEGLVVISAVAVLLWNKAAIPTPAKKA